MPMRNKWNWARNKALSACVALFAANVACDADGVEATPLSDAKAGVYRRDGSGPPQQQRSPIQPGPILFLDEMMIESSSGIERIVCKPVRNPAIPNPIVTGKEDGCFQPYLTVLRDADTGRFRLWYGRYTEDRDTARSRIGYMESTDGIHWERPARTLEDPAPIQFGVSVTDAWEAFRDPARRYVYAWHIDGGLKIATSSDGLAWSPISAEPLLRHSHDINGLNYDPLLKRFFATLSVYREGDGRWEGKRRITMQSLSTDLVHWSPAYYVLLPSEAVDDGETQFYAMDGYLRRGRLLIGMVKVLRDDLKADDPPDPPDAYGVGYTTLAWSHDGETWVRDPEHFFDPHPAKGEWDHAHAWIDEQVPVGDEVYLYYGGYARGHKVNRFEERQIGLVTMQRDRYVARVAGDEGSTLRMRPIVVDGKGLSLNVDAKDGEARVAVMDTDGNALEGFGFEDCIPVTVDALNAPVQWKRPAGEWMGKAVRLEISMRNARLYAVNIE